MALCWQCLPLQAGVIVLNNRTEKPIAVSVQVGLESTEMLLLPTSSRPFFVEEDPWVSYQSASKTNRLRIAQDSIYYFSELKNSAGYQIALRQISLAEKIEAVGRLRGKDNLSRKPVANKKAIRLMVYVDEEELMTTKRWKERLKKRVASASQIIEQHSGMPVQLVGYGRWQSDNRLNDFGAVLADFEQKIKPPEGVVAFGFTSQLELHRHGIRKLGGTRGPLRNHLLVREWAPQIAENERVEVLVHELGHYLGASHSPESTSVMRPVLGGGKTRLKLNQIQFDPLNTLAIATVAQELKTRNIKHFESITPSNRVLLASVYKTLGATLPDDPSSALLYKRASRGLASRDAEITSIESLVRLCLTEVTKVAATNRKRPRSVADRVGEQGATLSRPFTRELQSQATGDQLTNLYVKTIAKNVATSRLPLAEQRRAFLFALPLSVDRSKVIERFAFFKELASTADPARQRELRMNLIGQPTARQRNDSLLHFFVSAALTLQEGEEEARFWGYAKEAFDSLPDGSGFSFADIAANEAGIRFAKALLAGSITPEVLSQRFDIAHFVPSLEKLPEGLTQTEFAEKYGGQDDSRYLSLMDEIHRRIELLPPYFRFNMVSP